MMLSLIIFLIFQLFCCCIFSFILPPLYNSFFIFHSFNIYSILTLFHLLIELSLHFDHCIFRWSHHALNPCKRIIWKKVLLLAQRRYNGYLILLEKKYGHSSFWILTALFLQKLILQWYRWHQNELPFLLFHPFLPKPPFQIFSFADLSFLLLFIFIYLDGFRDNHPTQARKTQQIYPSVKLVFMLRQCH